MTAPHPAPRPTPTPPAAPSRDAEEQRRYFHDVGIASRIRIHRELAVDHETCPLCDEALR